MDEIKMQWKEAGVMMMDHHSKVGAKEFARKWNVGLQMAQDTLKVTTQMGIWTAVHPMTKCLQVNNLHLHHKCLCSTWHCDTVLSRVKSLLGNTCANIFTQGNFTKVIPMTA